MIKHIKLVTLLLFIFFFAGCLWIPPIPTKKHTVSERELNSIVIGRSTEKGIHKILGKPNRLDHEKYCVYDVEWSYGYVAGYQASVDLGGKQYRILVEFDENDILRNYDIEKGFEKSDGRKFGVAIKSDLLKTHKAILLWKKPQFSGYPPPLTALSNEQLIAVKSIHEPIWLINLETIEKRKLKNTEDAKYFQLSPDARYLAYVSDHVNILETVTQRKVSNFKGHGKYSKLSNKGPTVLTFFPDGNKIASGGHKGFVKIWETITGIEINSFKAYVGSVDSIAVSPDGKMLATAGDTGLIILWDSLSGYELGRIYSAVNLKYLPYGLKFSPNGNILAINKGSHVELIRINKKWSRLENLAGVFLLPFAGNTINTSTWHFLSFSKDGRNIAASNGSAIVWDNQRHEKRWRCVSIPSKSWFNPVWRIYLPSTVHAIVLCQNKNLLIVTTSKGVFLQKMQPPY